MEAFLDAIPIVKEEFGLIGLFVMCMAGYFIVSVLSNDWKE